MVIGFFFFDETATTEIYTYIHTLSLHDALPIWEHYQVAPDLMTMAKSLAGGMPLSAVCGRAEIMDAPAPGGLGGTYAGNPLAIASALEVIRSEEHTSELQSLMRISYAVFCLNKKKKQ